MSNKEKQVIKPCPECKKDKDWMTFIWKDGKCRCPECHEKLLDRNNWHRQKQRQLLNGGNSVEESR